MVASVSMNRVIQVAVCFALFIMVYSQLANGHALEDASHERGLKSIYYCGGRGLFFYGKAQLWYTKYSCSCANYCKGLVWCKAWSWFHGKCYIYSFVTHYKICYFCYYAYRY